MSSIRVAVDFYATLGVSHRATTKNINDAYQKLALKHHPDKAGTDAASLGKFQRIYEAVDTLRDPDRRRRYDHLQGIDKRDSRYEAGCARGTVYVDPWSMETLQPCCDPSEEKPESTNTYTLEIWEADYAGIDPELEKAKEKMRKEAMQQEGLDETTGNETDVELEDGEEGVELDQATEYATAEFCFHNGDVCDCYRYLFTDLTLEDDEGSGCLAQDSNMETTDDDESNNRLNIHQSDEVAEVHLDTNANAPLDSLRAYFQAKRIDGRGHYTTEDMHAKLHCMVLGTFCGWLEGARLSFPNAQPVSSQSDPHSCSHVGSWIKGLTRPGASSVTNGCPSVS
ncbi:hypothetical protein NUU61_009449 [Penicillium alfredii]|uniref:J domain-containing protein n=1 Tax=Penicillium alfredii TaxID=1506179 RepID=A0A9W9JX98_9EURO|nr:uncharacterized protein NUU61_009449 [Penicillium alfredii]KAJ5084870.1 hypothetical protein NUU61_009449 [Penicillium alfredii]